MEIQILHDKEVIYNYLKRDIENQIFCIGDLDDFYWSKTTWFSLTVNNQIHSIALLYYGMDIPTFLLFENKSFKGGIDFLKRIKTFLPKKMYAHLSHGLLDFFGSEHIIENYGSSYKMTLKKRIEKSFDENIRVLRIEDIAAIQELLSIAYPLNWFDSNMIQTEKYFGYFNNNKLIGVAGVHVYSQKYKVAALGNIATHPDFRGQGIALTLTQALCYNLQDEVEVISLNVRAINDIAVKCYEKIGFEITGNYDELLLRND